MLSPMLFGVIFVALVFFAVGKILYNAVTGSKGGKVRHCMTCGVDDQAKSVTRGSLAIEIVLWLCFLVPGLIYSIWRLTSRYEGCAACGSKTLIPFDSPAALAHRKSLAVSTITS